MPSLDRRPCADRWQGAPLFFTIGNGAAPRPPRCSCLCALPRRLLPGVGINILKAARAVFVAAPGGAAAWQHAARTWDAASPVERRLRAWRCNGRVRCGTAGPIYSVGDVTPAPCGGVWRYKEGWKGSERCSCSAGGEA